MVFLVRWDVCFIGDVGDGVNGCVAGVVVGVCFGCVDFLDGDDGGVVVVVLGGRGWFIVCGKFFVFLVDSGLGLMKLVV